MNDRDRRNLNAYTWRARTRARLEPTPENRADVHRVDPVYAGPGILESGLREHGAIVHTDRGPMPCGRFSIVLRDRMTDASIRVLAQLNPSAARPFQGRALPDVRR